MPSVPNTAAMTNLRRRVPTLPSSLSSFLEKIALSACTRDGFVDCGACVPAGSVVEFAILSPGPDNPAGFTFEYTYRLSREILVDDGAPKMAGSL